MKKLNLNRETVRNLTDDELGRAVGGKAPIRFLPTGEEAQSIGGGCQSCQVECGGDNTASGCVPYTQASCNTCANCG